MDEQRVEFDRGKLVAQVAEAVMQQPPGRRRFAVAGCTDEENGPAAVLERRGMQEEELGPQFLQGDHKVFLEVEEQIVDATSVDDDAVSRTLDRVPAAWRFIGGYGVAKVGDALKPRRCRGRKVGEHHARDLIIPARHLDVPADDQEAQDLLGRRRLTQRRRPGERPAYCLFSLNSCFSEPDLAKAGAAMSVMMAGGT